MKVITTEKKPIKMWLNDIEDVALEQAKNLANLPFIHKHVAIMPDSHLGYGMPIGGVIACEKVIIPNAVGVDIGCGMCSLKTNLFEITLEQLKLIRTIIRKKIPLGFKHHENAQDEILMPNIPYGKIPVIDKQYKNALYQLGTLGGGNHFIEIQKGSDGYIWIMIHSGSRNIGKQVADYHNTTAKNLNADYFSSVPPSWDLAFLPFNSKAGQIYFTEMNFCISFALANRELILKRVKESMGEIIPGIEFSKYINIPHNYAARENHYGKNVIVHRKGATRAIKGEIGIIPGSQGTHSYITEGLGNPLSFCSCSHGAGRKMSRTAAKKNLSLYEEQEKMENIVNGIEGINNLDEAPGAYKDIDIVMKNQSDLVKPLIEMTPLMVIKG